MTAGLYRDEPVFRAAIDRCADILAPMIGQDLRTVLYGGEAGAAEAIKQTRLAQPTIFAVSYALARLWMSWGIHPGGDDRPQRGRVRRGLPGRCFPTGRRTRHRGCARPVDAVAALWRDARRPPPRPSSTAAPSRPGPCGGERARALCVVASDEDAVASLEQALQTRAVTSRRAAYVSRVSIPR